MTGGIVRRIDLVATKSTKRNASAASNQMWQHSGFKRIKSGLAAVRDFGSA
jgi:hypothetical protein